MDKAFDIIFQSLLENDWAILCIVLIGIGTLIATLGFIKFFKSFEREYKDWKSYMRKK